MIPLIAALDMLGDIFSGGLFKLNVWTATTALFFIIVIIESVLIYKIQRQPIIKAYNTVKKNPSKTFAILNNGKNELRFLAADNMKNSVDVEDKQANVEYGTFDIDPSKVCSSHGVPTVMLHAHLRLNYDADIVRAAEYLLESKHEIYDVDKLVSGWPDYVRIATCQNKISYTVPKIDKDGKDIDYKTLTDQQIIDIMTWYNTIENPDKEKIKTTTIDGVCGHVWRVPIKKMTFIKKIKTKAFRLIGKEKDPVLDIDLRCKVCIDAKREPIMPILSDRRKEVHTIDDKFQFDSNRLVEWVDMLKDPGNTWVRIKKAAQDAQDMTKKDGVSITTLLGVGIFIILVAVGMGMVWQNRSGACVSMWKQMKAAGL